MSTLDRVGERSAPGLGTDKARCQPDVSTGSGHDRPAAAYAADTLANVVISSDLLLGPMIAASSCHAAGCLATNISIVPIPGMSPVGPGITPSITDEEREAAGAVEAWFATARR